LRSLWHLTDGNRLSRVFSLFVLTGKSALAGAEFLCQVI
jgi:hypothetical protein